uniref:Reverse transcriptase zinc-binding domain-containing protein n=2 Tax=rosids TaxID=71275 RepID=A0A7N2MYQ0_QUELO
MLPTVSKGRSQSSSSRANPMFPQYLRRIVKWQQMDIEYTFWQMLHLCTSPKVVYQHTKYHKQTKNQWARDDPAFVVICSFLLTVATLAYCAAYDHSAAHAVYVVISVLLFHFLVTGVVLATCCWIVWDVDCALLGSFSSEVLSPPVGDNDRVWSLRFHREFNDWELAASLSLLHFIQTRIPRGGGSDRLCWDLNSIGKFDTRSFYHKIRNAALSTFPWKGIWKVKVPKRVAFFMWTAAHGQILTLDNLMLRGRPLLFGIDWVMPSSVMDLLFSWYHWHGKHSSDIWDLVPDCLMWTERNQRSFEDEEKTVVQLLELCHRTLFDWFLTNSYLREEAPNSHVVEQRVEWLYAFDVHCNSFFPMFVLLYVIHYFLSPLLVAHGFIPILLSNLLYMVAGSYYHYLNFLGYDVLPFLERTTFFLYPIGAVIVLSPILILSGFNPSRYLMNMYFSQRL